MTVYYRAIPRTDQAKPEGAVALAGGWCWFDQVEVLQKGAAAHLIPARETPHDVLQRMTSPRADIASLDMGSPNIMGILNVTPDSFSDGGKFASTASAVEQAERMISDGVNILDIGGESTRPGALDVSISDEIARVVPVIATVRAQSDIAISIDTRKSDVAQAAMHAGATFVNDVSAMGFDAKIATVAAQAKTPICLMHAQGQPKDMQVDPRYENVVLDIYDYLAHRIEIAVQAGVERAQIVVDPGIGFGKTQGHNLAILRGISLFHSLGCPVLLGASRKKFIGDITQEPIAELRVGGSLAVALKAVSQGVQILRVHDTKETKQAIRLAQKI
ncbi:dihydropteroate synthase [Falsihalocynthiibacter arcticus]|uniref:Dihydropteroate synthase n=1 Tax=Falsihalocynthiibacter arcticus TaxID=1579316 RepID=A0A126UW12_9RHOB|nr:dihydropteroate synthase [Falsihalocynthiibacter arcticus]AML49915.1 dihydropteroate synthase [Falsihalocynthiibacter arcticus]